VNDGRPRRGRGLSYEARLTWLALLSGAPAVLVALILLWSAPHSGRVRITLSLVIVLFWLGATAALRERVVRPLQTLSNLLAALRESDYSIRARGAQTSSPLGLAFHEVNALAETLRKQRLDAREATALLRRVMEEIDVAIFAFDDKGQLRLINGGGELLIGLPAERLLGADAAALGLTAALEGATPRLIELALPGRAGRWEVRRGTYRWEGRPHELVVLSDLTHSLREEERLAWQRLIRVLSHEINNSLAPISSIASSLRVQLARDPAAAADDAAHGLEIIGRRADALSRLMSAYAQLARLPPPERAPVEVAALVAHVARLEARAEVAVSPGVPATLWADAGQLEQLLINLVRNAVDATRETRGEVEITWLVDGGRLDLTVRDQGAGLSNTANLFVPFYTTKPGGSGIGLALSRQIAEAHGGTLTLENRGETRGSVARLRLPIQRDESRPLPSATESAGALRAE